MRRKRRAVREVMAAAVGCRVRGGRGGRLRRRLGCGGGPCAASEGGGAALRPLWAAVCVGGPGGGAPAVAIVGSGLHPGLSGGRRPPGALPRAWVRGGGLPR